MKRMESKKDKYTMIRAINHHTITNNDNAMNNSLRFLHLISLNKPKDSFLTLKLHSLLVPQESFSIVYQKRIEKQ